MEDNLLFLSKGDFSEKGNSGDEDNFSEKDNSGDEDNFSEKDNSGEKKYLGEEYLGEDIDPERLRVFIYIK
jgi:hypothetical protein